MDYASAKTAGMILTLPTNSGNAFIILLSTHQLPGSVTWASNLAVSRIREVARSTSTHWLLGYGHVQLIRSPGGWNHLPGLGGVWMRASRTAGLQGESVSIDLKTENDLMIAHSGIVLIAAMCGYSICNWVGRIITGIFA